MDDYTVHPKQNVHAYVWISHIQYRRAQVLGIHLEWIKHYAKIFMVIGIISHDLGPLLSTWINFYTSIDNMVITLANAQYLPNKPMETIFREIRVKRWKFSVMSLKCSCKRVICEKASISLDKSLVYYHIRVTITCQPPVKKAIYPWLCNYTPSHRMNISLMSLI